MQESILKTLPIQRAGYSISEAPLSFYQPWQSYVSGLLDIPGIRDCNSVLNMLMPNATPESIRKGATLNMPTMLLPEEGFLDFLHQQGTQSVQIKITEPVEDITAVSLSTAVEKGANSVNKRVMLMFGNGSLGEIAFIELDQTSFDDEASLGYREVRAKLDITGEHHTVIDTRRVMHNMSVAGKSFTHDRIGAIPLGENLGLWYLESMLLESARFKEAAIRYMQIFGQAPRIVWAVEDETSVDEVNGQKEIVSMSKPREFGSDHINLGTYIGGRLLKDDEVPYPVNYLKTNFPPDKSLFQPISNRLTD